MLGQRKGVHAEVGQVEAWVGIFGHYVTGNGRARSRVRAYVRLLWGHCSYRPWVPVTCSWALKERWDVVNTWRTKPHGGMTWFSDISRVDIAGLDWTGRYSLDTFSMLPMYHYLLFQIRECSKKMRTYLFATSVVLRNAASCSLTDKQGTGGACGRRDNRLAGGVKHLTIP